MSMGSHRIFEECGTRERHCNKPLYFAKFPRDPHRCKLWVKAVGKEYLAYLPIEKLSHQRHVCGEHFHKNDFNKKGRLKKTAVSRVKLIAAPLEDDLLVDFPLHIVKHQNIPNLADVPLQEGTSRHPVPQPHDTTLPSTSTSTTASQSVRRLTHRELGLGPAPLPGGVGGQALFSPRMLSGLQLQRWTLGHLSAVYCLVFDCTGRYVVTGSDDLLVKVWSACDGHLLGTLRGAGAEITDVCISADNCLLAAGSVERLVRVISNQIKLCPRLSLLNRTKVMHRFYHLPPAQPNEEEIAKNCKLRTKGENVYKYEI